MIPNRTQVQTRGTLQGERIAMEFDESARAHLMQVMTDLYSDPELAVIREYSTNALDSHIEAGVKLPIEVTTPTTMAPFLAVTDHGVGLSVDDIHQIYSKYGASTKRDSNESVGMLGLGCKSALTYSAQFTVTAVKDGVRTQVAISRDEDGGGTMTIVDTSASSAANGVIVTIPVKSVNGLQAKAEKFFSFWKPGTVLLNGKEPNHPEGLSLADNLLLCKVPPYSGTAAQAYVVMGNVAYPTDKLSFSELDIPNNHALIATVPVGAVQFTPSREALHYTALTLKTIQKIKDDFTAALVGAVQREVDAAPTRSAAIEAVVNWRPVLGQRKLTLTRKGEPIPTSFSLPDDCVAPRILLTSPGSYRLSQTSGARTIDLSYFRKSVLVLDYAPEKFTAGHKHKLNKWITDNGIDQVGSIVLIDFDPGEAKKWFDPKRVVDWETIKAIKLPRNEARGPSNRIPGSFEIVVSGDDVKQGDGFHYGIPGDEIDFAYPVFWLHGNWHDARRTTALTLRRFHPNSTLVLLTGNRIDKFKRDAPKAVPAHEEFDRLAKGWFAGLSPQERRALAMREEYGLTDKLSSIEKWLPQIKDPAFAAAAKDAKVDVKRLAEERERFRHTVNIDFSKEKKIDPFISYPLLDTGYAFGRKMAANVDYINALYAYRLTQP